MAFIGQTCTGILQSPQNLSVKEARGWWELVLSAVNSVFLVHGKAFLD